VPPSETPFLREEHVLLDLPGGRLEAVARDLVAHLASKGLVPEDRVSDLEAAILERERKSSAAIGQGVFCPHRYADFIKGPAVVFARLTKGLALNSPDDEPCSLVFFLVGGPGDQARHLDALTQVARVLQDGDCRNRLEKADSPPQAVAAVTETMARQREHAEPDSALLARAGLEKRTGRFMGGVLDDIRRRLPHYGDDFTQGLKLKSLATTIFLFFACFTAAVTFGALMDAETGGAIGAMDMLMATAVCGVIYALVAGQPLVILGGTGPLLVFTALLFQLTGRFESLEFLPFYTWVGLWAALFTVILAVTDASVWIRYFTRFTDEVFVLLIAAIFIVEALSLLMKEFEEDELIGYATAVSAVILAFGTFGIAIGLRQIRRSGLLRRWARNFLADFGVVIAIAGMSAMAYFMRGTTELPHIKVPTDISLSLSDHLVPLGSLPAWGIAAAAVPGAFAAILIFLDQQITARVVNAPEFNLQKGPGYHLDLLLVGLLTALCSVLGWPWLVAATVRSLNHVAALATTHTEDRPGAPQRVTDRVIENRVTGVAIHALIGCSILLVPLLGLVPMACLYGVFLYMGIATLGGNQMFQRITLWVRDPAMYPRTHYLRRVPSKVVHAFTVVQVLCLTVLWLVKVSAAAILFPLVLAMLVPVRMLLPKFFKEEHLEALDAEETPEEEVEREAAP
jgi:mannitol/fructose-specific phosphotransferase system IIA component (Ntr-type)